MRVENITIGEEFKFVGANWRPEDVLECHYAAGRHPDDAVLYAIYDQFVVHGVYDDDGRLLVAFGIKREDDATAIIWGLATEEARAHKIALLRMFRRFITKFLGVFGTLTNAVWAGNQEHVDFLRWLGADFGPPYKIKDQEFIPFTITRGEK